MKSTLNIHLVTYGPHEGVEKVVSRMRAALRGDQIDLRYVASVEGWSQHEPIYNFEIDRAAACGLEPGTLTVLEWNRPVIVHGEPGRSFEFVGETSPLLAISDLSTQHSDVRFGCLVAVTGEDDEEVLEADGDFIQGM